MGIRLIHTADLQIGKGFGQFPPEIAATLRAARLETLRRIAALAHERRADAVLVAGDCFDDLAVADETLRRFRVALEPFQGPWLLLPGNHDPAIAESPWTRLRRLGLPPNVIIADEPAPIALGHGAVILPAPLRRRRDAADLTEWFGGALTESHLIRIGLAHGSVRDFLPQASEAANPIAPDRAEEARLDYLALGDWHGRLQISERCWYAGTPEPDRFRANEPGHVLEVTIEAPGAPPQIDAHRVARFRWQQSGIDLAPGGAEEILRAIAADPAEMQRLVLRFDLTGAVDLATRAAIDEVLKELRVRVAHLETDDGGLVMEPTEDDLDGIDTAGFVRVAMERLWAMLAGPQAETARRALALLHGLHRQGGN
ncbi:MAG TPA: DNA repair exonuclease [Paracoccaceae bacterium]|nr:DNA repair exonuclease [Paracoccaceae bacterium]